MIFIVKKICSTSGLARKENGMKVLDIFSWLSAKEISLEQLQQIFMDYKSGIYHKGYTLLSELPDNAAENVIACKNVLQAEGKKVAYILKDENIIAVIAYKE